MADLRDRVVEAESGFGADHEKIERVGQAVFETHPSPRGKAGEDSLGATPAEEKGASQKCQSNCGSPQEQLAPLEKQPTERDEYHAAANLAANKGGEMAVPLDPGRDQGPQQALLLGDADNLRCSDFGSEPLIPGRVSHSCRFCTVKRVAT